MPEKFEPFKFVGELVCVAKDDEGNVIGEQAVAQITLYAHQFGNLPLKVDEVMDQVRGGGDDELHGDGR